MRRINGIGTVSRKEIETILTRDGKQAVKDGSLTWAEAGEMYKLELVRKASVIGSNGDTFAANYNRIPEELQDKLTPEELGKLVDAFYRCYGDGKNAK